VVVGGSVVVGTNVGFGVNASNSSVETSADEVVEEEVKTTLDVEVVLSCQCKYSCQQ
jgi:hypothetical protein